MSVAITAAANGTLPCLLRCHGPADLPMEHDAADGGEAGAQRPTSRLYQVMVRRLPTGVTVGSRVLGKRVVSGRSEGHNGEDPALRITVGEALPVQLHIAGPQKGAGHFRAAAPRPAEPVAAGPPSDRPPARPSCACEQTAWMGPGVGGGQRSAQRNRPSDDWHTINRDCSRSSMRRRVRCQRPCGRRSGLPVPFRRLLPGPARL